MNRKITLFIVTALLTSLVWVSSVLAAPEAPTVSMEVCVAVEGGRAVGNDESITYSLAKTSGGGGATYAGADTAAIQAAPTSKACFDVVAEPGETYNLTVSAADTLSTTLNGIQINSGASNDLTGSITLLEGDLNGDNVVNGADFSLFGATWLQAGAGLDGDLNEEGNVNGSDFSLFGAHWLQAGSRAVASQARGDQGTATVMVEPAADYTSAAPFTAINYVVRATNNNAELIKYAQVHINFGPALIAPTTVLGAACTPIIGTPCTLDLAGPEAGGAAAGTRNVGATATGGGSTDVNQPLMIIAFFVPAPGCDAVNTCFNTLELIGADTDDATDNRTLYENDSRALIQFSNCGIGEACAAPTAIALSSNVATPNQSVATIVLVFVASVLVIGSRFAVLNKRK